MSSIFRVENAHLERLGPEGAVEFVRGLLWAEATRIGLPTTQISISSWVDVPDGGIDAAVEDNSAVPPSSFLRKGHVGYQIKAGNFEPWKDSTIKRLLFGDKGIPKKANLGSSIKDCLEKGGRYVLVCPGIDPPRKQELEAKALLKKYSAKSGYSAVEAEVWGQNRLIGLLQRHPSMSLSVNGRGHLKFQTHKSWSQNVEMKRDFHAGPRQQEMITDVRAALRRTDIPVHVRLLGDPGIGKTRLVLEATGAEDLASAVLYVGSGAAFRDSELLNEMLKDDNQFAAVLVIDECDRETRADIWNRLHNLGSRVRLVTINSEPEETAGDTQYFDALELENTQIAEILKEYGVPGDQTERWAELCGGSPRVGHMVGSNLKTNPQDMLREPDTAIVWDRYIVGRDRAESPSVQQRRTVLRHLALFKRFGYEGGLEVEARTIQALVQQADPSITWMRFKEIIRGLRDRKILQGESTLYLTPKLLHIKLWVDFWETYGAGFDVAAFIDGLSQKLKEWFFEMFAYAAESRTATEVVKGFLGPSGLFQRTGFLDHPLGSRFFRALAEAHPGPALQCLIATIGTWDPARLEAFRDGRRNVVWALQGIAVWREFFSDAARLLLQLAEAENETWGNNATGVFAGLFSAGPGRVAPTEASPEERFPVLVEALHSDWRKRCTVALKAADAGLEASHFVRFSGPEYQGLRVLPRLWQPKTNGEMWDAHRRVWKLLASSAEALEAPERQEAISILLKRARGIARNPHLLGMVVDTLTDLTSKTYVDKTRVIEAVVRILRYDGKEMPAESRRRWEALRDSLVGDDFSSLMQRYVAMDLLEDKFNDDGGYVEGQTEPKIESLVRVVLENPQMLDAELSWLLTPAAKNGYRFGYRLGRADPGFSLLAWLIQAQQRAGDQASAFFLGGYFRALHELDIERWESTLDELSGNEQLRRWVPELTWRSGVTERAAVRMISLAEEGLAPASSLRMFAFGGALRNVSESTVHRWIAFLLRVDDFEAMSIALELFTFYYHRETVDPPKELALKLLIAPAFFRRTEDHPRTDMMTYEWAELAKKIVRLDPDAALELADIMLQHFGEDGTVVEGFFSQPQHVLDDLFRARPRDTWKLVTKYLGPPIDGRAYHITSWLRGDTFDGEGQGILSLVPLDALWQWVDEDVAKRAWYLASFVPKVLSRGTELISLAREILIRYGRRGDVRSNLMSNFSTEGWTGPESLHYQLKKSRLLEFRKEETNANVKRWIDEYVDGLNRQIARAKVEEERRH